MSSGKKKTDAGASSATKSTTKNHEITVGAVQAKDALAVIFAVRIINALCVRTFFQPDEYFQALEPAWNLVFGEDSGAWLTWEWKHQLRSSVHPAVFAIGYWIVQNFQGSKMHPVTKTKWLLAAPKVLQAGFAALSDWYSWRLAERLYGRGSAAAWSVLLMALVNPWQWYTSTRTFSNCFETTLTAMALYYWPWEILGTEDDENVESKHSSIPILQTWGQINNLRLSLILAAFAVLLRPTNILIWAAISTLTLTRATLSGKSPLTLRNCFMIYREVVFCGSFVLGLSLLADRLYYGEWTFPPLTFLHFNVAQDLASFYGENDWHYYLSQGIPLLGTTITPFILKGIYRSLDSENLTWPVVTSNALKALSFVAFTNISALSFVSHKEVRFITPLLPAFHILAAPYVTSFFTALKNATSTSSSPTLGWKRTPLLLAGLLVNAIIGGYLSWLHAAAPIKVVNYLRSEFENIHPKHLAIPQPANVSVDEDFSQELFALFLTPCHATPWRSHLVYPALRARALTCEPPLHTAPGSLQRQVYQDETRRFYADKIGFLKELWPRDAPGEDMARYIVGYEDIGPALYEYFDPMGPGGRHRVELVRVWDSWNGLFTDDDRKSGRLVVWATGFYDKVSPIEP
ncbi:glycosyltransferase family 22 protein [Daldinia caldariorum]|uniref:glycosyltransferase family 22 protein n=1 Tax=Daldinia caldariorum TaxID=326644 RepID=UPI002008707C|nr:glycosyltransferase family 22 protein [Daldinia caldariorum]KAI1467116.1 glycosyltransferase family 22 protein [Daldinia caldariorum]